MATGYDAASALVRHADLLGASDPHRSVKVALRAEIDEAAPATLDRAASRPFPRPRAGRIAVRVINPFGDAMMTVYGV